MSLTDQCTRVYRPTGRMAHLLPLGASPSVGYPGALCGMQVPFGRDWLGTGSQAEYDEAASLPTCGTCAARAAGMPAITGRPLTAREVSSMRDPETDDETTDDGDDSIASDK